MKRVLIVDDNKTLQKIIARIVSDRLEVLPFASDGNEGFTLYKALKPDLVLLDVTMPNCSGKQCLQMIMEIDPHAKVIMVSGLADEGTSQECIQLGAKAFVNKNLISLQNATGDNPLAIEIEKVLGTSFAKAA